MFYIFYFSFDSFLSLLLNKKNPHSIVSFFGGKLVWKPFFLFAGALLFDEKSAKVLRKPCREPFGRPQSVLRKYNVWFPHFVETGLRWRVKHVQTVDRRIG
jgi:hypothetical protein